MLYDGTYLTDDEFLSHFHMDQSCVMQLNRMVEDDQELAVFPESWAKEHLHIMVLLKFLGSYGNEVALQKLGLMMGISKWAVNNYVRRALSRLSSGKHRGTMGHQWQDQKGSRFSQLHWFD